MMEVVARGRMEGERCRSSMTPEGETWTMMMVIMSRLNQERKLIELLKRKHSDVVNIVSRPDGKISGEGKLLTSLRVRVRFLMNFSDFNYTHQ